MTEVAAVDMEAERVTMTMDDAVLAAGMHWKTIAARTREGVAVGGVDQPAAAVRNAPGMTVVGVG